MTRRWVDDWPDLESKGIERSRMSEAWAAAAVIAGLVIVSVLGSYFGLAWLVSAL